MICMEKSIMFFTRLYSIYYMYRSRRSLVGNHIKEHRKCKSSLDYCSPHIATSQTKDLRNKLEICVAVECN